MTDEFKVEKGTANGQQMNSPSQPEHKIINEADYKIRAPREKGPTAIGRGGDPLYKRINASNEELRELMEETQTVQDWIQRETSNNVALACLDDSKLKDVYFEIKDGFGQYGKIILMGFKTPNGTEIPRLKIYDTNGEVIEVLTGPLAIDELNKRALAYKNSQNGYEVLYAEEDAQNNAETIADYSGNPDDYTT